MLHFRFAIHVLHVLRYTTLWHRDFIYLCLTVTGGKLIFDEKDVELQSNIIMITDGGLLQVGTETEPFQHKGIITLHGHHRSRELPIYGTKVLAVRNGTLDLHGTFLCCFILVLYLEI